METGFRGRVFVDLPGLSTVRDEQGVTQKALAEQSGVSYVNISRIENGQHATVQTATKLARALRVHLDALTIKPPENSDRLAELEEEIKEKRETYYRPFAGGTRHDEGLATLYADLAMAKGGTWQAMREVLLKAIRDGERRGLIIAQEEKEG